MCVFGRQCVCLEGSVCVCVCACVCVLNLMRSALSPPLTLQEEVM